MSVLSPQPSLPEKWEGVLSKVDLMLDATLVAATHRLNVLDSLADDESSRRRMQEVIRARDALEGLNDRLQAAEAATAAADLELAGGEKIARDYLAQNDDLWQKLADWTERAIG